MTKSIHDKTIAELPKELSANELEYLFWHLAGLLLDRAASRHYARKWIAENLQPSEADTLHIGWTKHDFEHNCGDTLAEYGGKVRHVTPSDFRVLLEEAGFRISEDRELVFAAIKPCCEDHVAWRVCSLTI